jgi:hypothetical protein
MTRGHDIHNNPSPTTVLPAASFKYLQFCAHMLKSGGFNTKENTFAGVEL